MPLGKGLGSLIPNFKQTGATAETTTKSFAGGNNFAGGSAGSKENQLWNIPVSLIKANAYQPRQVFEHQDLEDLVNSIKEHGILQPLLVTENEDGSYELVAGERRFRAAQILGLSTVPALIKKIKGSAKLELALIENIQRKNLNPLEEAFAYQRLINEFALTQEEVAKKVGKSRPYIGNHLRLLSLPEEIKNGLIEGEISSSSARAILGLSSAKEQIKFYHKLKGNGATVHQVETQVAAERLKKTGLTRRDPLVLDFEKRLREKLGTKVEITKNGAKGKITIEYYSDEELRRLVKEIID
ncbi:MAG: ParB-like protein partition protein [Candidatus Magasanikbacteria bacterium GW2011_GWC2_40_17]|uniref:ParB-like protein partition protein n=1 Tax=Candidatus Magasanikbacteria bacterium GW2011_GWA2_42_32 TaxID=1619039 RepID=A0A0G1A6W7_9BACT|nr:MAG: ParB-like protein partition protein [Candidatus Magasanikbacteria bacterium GW2011_GWC2_40_17]KKS56770.1 MAG: ParB-like protein partition protein [Candidatus Magasanikbacteria bacterium GW2011_GWA2_42_32]OGH86041.1 MAG: hypothetical protein A2294_02140 [Candidatus Magasanikbacteria bacterium RIFOXYB2_FULL_38_10]